MTNKKWEYEEFALPQILSSDVVEFLNEKGCEGWEYVREEHLCDDIYITFKRPYYDE